MDDIEYISGQITKAERNGYFEKINYLNAEFCIALLKEIRVFCNEKVNARKEDEAITAQYPWPEPR